MAQIVIAVKYALPELKKMLDESMFFFQKDDCKLNLEESVLGGWPHLVCRLRDDNSYLSADKAVLYRQYLSGILADFIIKYQSESYLEEIIKHHYFYFPRNERKEILRHAGSMQNDGEIDRNIYQEIQNSISEYIVINDYLNLHGFIVFRQRFWLTHLRKLVDQAVDNFLMEKEYQEFIKLLKYFVELQEPRIHQVHVVLDAEGNLRLLDQSYRPVDSNDQGIEWDNTDEENGQDDLLVSRLITVAPNRIVLHRQVYTHYPKATDTLKHVFEKRVTLCKRCKLCHEAENLHQKGKS